MFLEIDFGWFSFLRLLYSTPRCLGIEFRNDVGFWFVGSLKSCFFIAVSCLKYRHTHSIVIAIRQLAEKQSQY